MEDFCDDPRFSARVVLIAEGRPHRSSSLRDDLRMLSKLLAAARRHRVLLLHTSFGKFFYPSLVVCFLMRFVPRARRPRILLMGDFYQPDGGFKGAIQHLVMWLAKPGVAFFGMLSADDIDTQSAAWGLPRGKCRDLSFHYTIRDDELDGTSTGDHIFAGGNVLRDYASLVAAAALRPDLPFVLATSRLPDDIERPDNVQAGLVPHNEFMRLLRTARAVVVPLRPDLKRSAAQQTYLNAMRLGKPVIVTLTPGVANFIRDRETGLIVDGSVQGFVDAIDWVLDPANAAEIAAMAERARDEVNARFTREAHVSRILAVIDEACAL